MAAQIAGSQHRIIPLAGLATNPENPQAVNQAIIEFLWVGVEDLEDRHG